MDTSLMGWCSHKTSHCRWCLVEVSSNLTHQCAGTRDNQFGSFCVQIVPSIRSHNVVSDNTTVVALIQHQGGTHYQNLSQSVEDLMLWAQRQGWYLSAVHLAGSKNVLADLLSRKDSVVPTEWTLSYRIFNKVWEIWSKPEIDLFATRFNARLPLFVSPVPDDRAWAVDAMSLEWDNLNAYAFPPISLVLPVLKKARSSQARIILIAPWWPTANWFMLVRHMSHVHPIPLNIEEKDLFQPLSQIQHQGVEALNLHAWLLCGKSCVDPVCQKQL